MKISNERVASTPLASQPSAPAVATGQAQSGVASDAGGYVPSAELVNLVSLLGQQAEVRPEAVKSALDRLHQGQFHTAAAANLTAAAMLGSAD